MVRLVDSIKQIRLGKKNVTFKETEKYSFHSLAKGNHAHSQQLVMRAFIRQRRSANASENLIPLGLPERLKEFVKAYLKDQKIFLCLRENYTPIKRQGRHLLFSQAGGV